MLKLLSFHLVSDAAVVLANNFSAELVDPFDPRY